MIMSGRRKTRAEFQERINQKDAAGENVEVWQKIYACFVNVRSLGADTNEDNAINYQVSQFELTAHYNPTLEKLISTSNRILMNGKLYKVISEIGRASCRERV